MKILVVSSLYPNVQEPATGVFVEQQVRELARLADVRVIAPVVWKPGVRVPPAELRAGIPVEHPSRIVIPKTGRCFYGELYYRGIRGRAQRLAADFDCDVILAYFAYPDGYAAMRLGRQLRKPVCVAALGSDIKMYTRSRLRRRLTLEALNCADRVIAVSAELASAMRDLGVDAKRIVTLLNGVDTAVFYPQDTLTVRRSLGMPLDRKLILFVGNLKPVKGVLCLVDACIRLMRESPSAYRAVLVGEGVLRRRIEAEITRARMQQHILLTGARKHSEIPRWINASDVVCLPSVSEGCPNIVLEAFACAKPVVATSVGGIPELITSGELGILVPPGDAAVLAQALRSALDRRWDSSVLQRRIHGCSWADNARLLYDQLRSIAGEQRP